MRRIVIAGLGTVSSLVLLLTYPTSHNASTTSGVSGTTSQADDGSVAAAQDSSSSSSGTTYTGEAVPTEFGPVQVQITVGNGKVTTSQAVRYPDGDHHSQRINQYAVPTLNSEAVAAQSASIDAVSGATITSDAYTTSLQSALDAAGL